jgi:hypothetical protein
LSSVTFTVPLVASVRWFAMGHLKQRREW